MCTSSVSAETARYALYGSTLESRAALALIRKRFRGPAYSGERPNSANSLTFTLTATDSEQHPRVSFQLAHAAGDLIEHSLFITPQMAPALHSAKSEQQAPLRVACIGGVRRREHSNKRGGS